MISKHFMAWIICIVQDRFDGPVQNTKMPM